MGASPKHKLSAEGQAVLEHINAGGRERLTPPQADMWNDYREIVLDIIAGAPHKREGKIRMILRRYSGLRFTPVIKTGPSFERLSDWRPDFEDPIRYQDSQIWKPEPVSYQRIRYLFATFLMELWKKGPERLKRCEWEKCLRLFWDPTNTQIKRYCEGLHDRERAKKRESDIRHGTKEERDSRMKKRERESRPRKTHRT